MYSGTFTYQGSNFHTEGVRLVMQRQLTRNVTAAFDYAYGGVVDLVQPNVSLANVSQSSGLRQRQSAAGKISGTIAKSKTRWMASYRRVSGEARQLDVCPFDDN